MNRIEALMDRYSAVKSLVRYGVEIVAVADPAGARLNIAVRQLLPVAHNDDPDVWNDLLGAVKALRWRRVTQPQPARFNPTAQDIARRVEQEVAFLRDAVANTALLDEVRSAATEMAESDPPVGPVLLRSIEEVGADACMVVAANRPAQAAMEGWLADHGALVVAPGQLELAPPHVDLAYAIGPPRFYHSAMVTAPVTSEINFLLPAWFADRNVPQSTIAPYAERPIVIRARILTEGAVAALEHDEAETDDELLPQPAWGARQSPDRDLTSDEVEAHKVLLSGNHAIWLDDGHRIRALDPSQPAGERVIYLQVDAVRPGTYLLLRQGETEHGALFREALDLLGKQAGAIMGTQQAWKGRLAQRLSELGYRDVESRLKAEGVRTSERARAWIDPHLIRPNSDHDFSCLLTWLDIPLQPTVEHATRLRRSVYRASANIRDELETAISATDLSDLEPAGYLSLEVQTDRVRGILAARVLAVSPFLEIVQRHETRALFGDRS
ncbi:MAG: hypothetical protein F4089_11540 [Gammaproteobacteria bacterium]|nr:hypothetical protein [Gammaproteobacteria bacterium]